MATTKKKPRILAERLAEVQSILPSSGSHARFENGACIMEMAAFIAGRPHSDHPECVSPVIGAFMRSWNDALPTDADRDRLLKPLLPEIIGTADGPESEEARAWLATDWLARVHTPAWLRLAGLTAQAEQLEALPELNPQTTQPILAALHAVRADAAKAWDALRAASRDASWDASWDALWDALRAAAWDASGDAARDAARAAARAAAGDAAWDAAGAASWAAAGAASRAAAWAAAGDALKPTVEKLQASAQELVRRMAAVHRIEPVVVPAPVATA